ncbi:MAG: glycosyltransferase family 2 protein [Hyphomicrobiales bacterium]|nr:glycosyltransferase family 2 protein [Hyphomicrobiales bacterium]
MAEPAPQLTVVAPVFNEAENIDPLLARLRPVLERCGLPYEIILVDDGSQDGTLGHIRAAHAADPRVRGLSFSRNFGKEIAIAAGLDAARGAAVVIMDSDLQHPPETIEQMVALWRQGYQNIYGVRRSRSGDSRVRQALTQRFYRLFDRFGETALPPGAGDFRLLDRVAVNALNRMRERARFSKGLYAWIGFKSIGVPFDVAERASGTSKFTYSKLTRFALDGLMSFSTIPLMVWTFVGVVISVIALAMALYFVGQTILYGVDVPGFATLVVSVTFFAGVQLLSLGVLGEYIGRIFAEVKGRPLYLVAESIGETGGPPDAQSVTDGA